MDWTDEEKKTLLEAHSESTDEREQVWMVARRAVELIAARSGTMTAEELNTRLGHLDSLGDGMVSNPVRDHLSAHVARIAELEKSLEATRKERDDDADRSAAFLLNVGMVLGQVEGEATLDTCERVRRERDEAVSRQARNKETADIWRRRVNEAADALGDFMLGQFGRLSLVPRIAELKRHLDGARSIHAANVEAGCVLSAEFDKAGVGEPRDGVFARARLLLDEVKAAMADNAALLRTLDAVGHMLGTGQGPDAVALLLEVTKAAHPGAALLERVKELEDADRRLRESLRDCKDCGDDKPVRLCKACVRVAGALEPTAIIPQEREIDAERAKMAAERDEAGALLTAAEGLLDKAYAIATTAHAREKEAQANLKSLRDAWRKELGSFIRYDQSLELDALTYSTRDMAELAREAKALKQSLEARERDLMAHFEEKNKALAEVEALRQRCAEITAAGQVLSEYVDKERPAIEGRAVLAERDLERAKRALLRAGFRDHGGEEWAPPVGAQRDVEWSMRDELAKAAMQGYCAVRSLAEYTTEDILAEMAYAQADAMLAERAKAP